MVLDVLWELLYFLHKAEQSLLNTKMAAQSYFKSICTYRYRVTTSNITILKINHRNILSSDDILQIDTLPDSIAIVGGGVIGLEFASLLTDLNVNVKVIEAGKRILPSDSKSISTF